MKKQFNNKKLEEILTIFEDISQVPRCSKNEDAISEYLVNWAKENGFEVETDEVKNVLVKVPASKGYEDRPIVALQGHMDMVCEKNKDSNHDFTCDPIRFVFGEDGWLRADGTTLGADNGIAVAMAMALAKDKSLKHGELEILFTVDEETEMTGAMRLKEDFLKAKYLINIDSEEEGEFTIGSAGGEESVMKLKAKKELLNKGDYILLNIFATGMKGGHSGMEINIGKANALKVLVETLKEMSKVSPLCLLNIDAGTAHNAIPREALAKVAVKKDKLSSIKEIIEKLEKEKRDEFKVMEKSLEIQCTEEDFDFNSPLFIEEDSLKLINLLFDLPHGVYKMSKESDDLVETSNNLAICKTREYGFEIVSSQRSSVVKSLDEITALISDKCNKFGAEIVTSGRYPGWEPDFNSSLVAESLKSYQRVFNKKAKVIVIHAGLECGIIGEKYPDMEMISLGPTIMSPHSPDERLKIDDVAKVWDFLKDLLENL